MVYNSKQDQVINNDSIKKGHGVIFNNIKEGYEEYKESVEKLKIIIEEFPEDCKNDKTKQMQIERSREKIHHRLGHTLNATCLPADIKKQLKKDKDKEVLDIIRGFERRPYMPATTKNQVKPNTKPKEPKEPKEQKEETANTTPKNQNKKEGTSTKKGAIPKKASEKDINP